ncbi:MAG: cation transporter dimerization domain-containing protein, partial [Anaerolineales bacterium]
AWLDPLVAGVVVVLLFRAAFGILRSTSEVLTDVAVADPEAVRDIALSVPGVSHVGAVRSRGRTDAAYVDLHVKVNPAMDTDQAHAVASEVEHRLSEVLPGVVDTIVHVEPARPEPAASPLETIALTLRGLADGLGIGLHDLHAHAERDGGYSVEMHVEVEAGLTLGQAHNLADEFERRARESLPELRSFVTHIEPLPAALPDEAGRIGHTGELRQRITTLADDVAGPGACHNVELHNVEGHLTATLHVTQPADEPLVEAHALAEAIERRLHSHESRLDRVVVHVEPPEQ